MKKYEVLTIPSSDDERKFENIDDFDVAVHKAKSHKNIDFYLHSFSSKEELNAYILGYTQGVGYMGNGTYFTKEEGI